MRVTVRGPEELGKEVKRRTDNVSACVVEAFTEKMVRERRDGGRDFPQSEGK